jgi:hypothetical protein
MIIFPSNLAAVPDYPGYFWDVEKHRLYSIKCGGELRPLKKRRLWGGVSGQFPRRHANDPCYRISHKGSPRYLFERDLKTLTVQTYHFPIVE